MAEGLSVGVVVSDFNGSITSGLLAGALEALEAEGIDLASVVHVEGAWELPVVAAAMAAEHDCVVALGAVIAGETDHYEHIATQTIAGLARVALDSGVPVGMGVLTVRDVAHASERSKPGPGNKGAEAVTAAIGAVAAIRSIKGGS
jgi:6,7-dimethyl-8-ribityllumazine synthase